jgi:hypothetical protein
MMKKLGDVVEQRLNRPRRPTYRPANDSLARGLGWFSIGLGLAELLMPRALARGLGLQGREHVLLLYGIREVVNGAALLVAANRTPWMWGRVAGDAIDIATLASAMRPGRRLGPAVGLAAVAGVTAVDIANASALTARDRRRASPAVDYSDRSGFPRPPAQMRGAALSSFQTPRHMRADLPKAPDEAQAELNM